VSPLRTAKGGKPWGERSYGGGIKCEAGQWPKFMNGPCSIVVQYVWGQHVDWFKTREFRFNNKHVSGTMVKILRGSDL
jgi:hypothetical protein